MGDRAAEQAEREGYRAVVLQAWINTRMEKDRTLIAVSSGGIGLLVTLLATADEMSWIELVLYLAAILFFVACVVLLILVFGKNADLLLCAYQTGKTPKNTVLAKMDRCAIWFFWIALAVALIIGALAGHSRIPSMEDNLMTDDKNNRPNDQPKVEQISEHSLDGLPDFTIETPVAEQGAAESDSPADSGGADSSNESGEK